MATPERITSYSNDGFTFDVLDSGPIGGEIIVCLHGFPQPASSWDLVAERLVADGYRVIAPTQRGYSLGARPRERRAYTTDKLAGDIAALVDALDTTQVHIVGHDWGGAVAWAFGALFPERTATLTAVSTPHPGAMQQSFTHSSQGLKSWYMGFFQLPKVPEFVLGPKNTKRVVDGLTKDGLRPEAAQACADLLADPATARGMVNWYRALPFSLKKPIGTITVPTLYVWSDGDHYLGRYAAQHTEAFVSGPYRFVEITGGSHWIPDEHPERLANAIIAQAAEYPANQSK